MTDNACVLLHGDELHRQQEQSRPDTQRENITRVCFIFSVKINYEAEQLKTISENNSFNL